MLSTRPYEFLQVKGTEQAVRLLWHGKANFTASFMSQSTAFKYLFVHSTDKRSDSEALERSEALTFNRNANGSQVIKMHGLSYQGLFTRMSIIYQAEVFISIAILVAFTYQVVGLYTLFVPIFPNLMEMSLNPTTLPTELFDQETLDFMISIFQRGPGTWWNAMYTQAWCLTVPFMLINKFAFAKLTKQPF